MSVRSENPCPVCGERQWVVMALAVSDELSVLSNGNNVNKNSSFEALIDETNTHLDIERKGKVAYFDECCHCGTVVC